jgi:hypothetical protein
MYVLRRTAREGTSAEGRYRAARLPWRNDACICGGTRVIVAGRPIEDLSCLVVGSAVGSSDLASEITGRTGRRPRIGAAVGPVDRELACWNGRRATGRNCGVPGYGGPKIVQSRTPPTGFEGAGGPAACRALTGRNVRCSTGRRKVAGREASLEEGGLPLRWDSAVRRRKAHGRGPHSWWLRAVSKVGWPRIGILAFAADAALKRR